jgi:cytochrome oxidase Cu insertion factor (SCO1/SenC/PrrC family)
MPSGDIADIGSSLATTLLWSGLLALLAASIAGALFWVVRRDQPGIPADYAEPHARRFVRVSFALLWIVDGLLQAQPRMPAGFVPTDMDPTVQTGPHWFGALVAPLLRAWMRHPVAADAAVVWIEIGAGLLLLVGRRGTFAKIASWTGVVAGLAIWVLGEAFGGLFSGNAAWLTGAPGAALLYAMAAGLLLAPDGWWASGRAQLLLRRGGAAWLAVAALLEAIPADGFWRSEHLSAPFALGATTRQPGWLNAPMRSLTHVAENSPAPMNLTVVLVVAATATWLWFDARTPAICTALALCAATWWLAQDFGVLGGTATDPNSALPVGLLIAGALPAWAARPAPASGLRPPAGLRAAAATLAISLTAVVPGVLAIGLVRRADSAALAADSGGGLQVLPGRRAPAFALTDQHQQPVSSQGLRGKVVLVTFLDPVCTSDCPLIANQLAIADRGLGSLARQVAIVAIDTNPVFHNVTDVAAFTDSHGLGGLANWHFLAGPPATTQRVLASYGISVDVPAVGMIEHSEGLFFIRPDGTEAAYLDDGAARQLTETYAQQVERQLRSMLP